jgi:maltooligosyltrehalose synthase
MTTHDSKRIADAMIRLKELSEAMMLLTSARARWPHYKTMYRALNAELTAATDYAKHVAKDVAENRP